MKIFDIFIQDSITLDSNCPLYMQVNDALLSNLIQLILSKLKFYETELKLVDLSTSTLLQITLPEEEYILSVWRDEKDLVDDCVFNVFDPSFLRIWHDEKTTTSKDIIWFIEVPKGDYSEFFTVLACFCS